MKLQLLLASALTGAALAAVNEPCYGPNGAAGVCVSTASCSSSGGTSIAGGCPSDPADVRCCSKPSCSGGNCRWRSDCAAGSVAGQCPGPSAFACCQSSANGFGGYGTPAIPPSSSCRAPARRGAEIVRGQFPGRIREMFCIRDCACGSGSDHCCGMAIDFMISDAGGTATLSGAQIAEWVMNNRANLALKYVIWGQRIWTAGRDAVGPWSSWRGMEDRGDITQNHWDHVHVSFN